MRQVHYYKLLQFHCKMQQLLQNAAILLQDATFITNAWVHCVFGMNIRVVFSLS